MSKYLPQGTYIVCSHQVDTSPGEIIADPNIRQLTVIYKSKEQPLLTEKDLLLKKDFECKNNWGSSLSWSAFVGGLVAGLAIGVAVVLCALTFGVGAVIIGVALVATAATFAITSKATKCNPNLVKWKNPHSKVNLEGRKALTQTAFLTCSAGPGILTPFLNEDEAKVAARNVGWRNIGEVGLTTLISGLFGYGVGYTAGVTGGVAYSKGASFSSVIGSGLFAGGKEFFFGLLGAVVIYQPISNLQKSRSQSHYSSKDGDTAYDSMLNARKEMEGDFDINSPDDFYMEEGQATAINKSVEHGYNYYRQSQIAKYINEIQNIEGTQAEKKAKVAEIVNKMNKTQSGAQAVEAMKGKQSGKIYTRNPKLRKMNQGRRVVNQHRAKTSKGFKSEISKGFVGRHGLKALGLILPLLVSPLNERTFNILAELFGNQSEGSVTIHSSQH